MLYCRSPGCRPGVFVVQSNICPAEEASLVAMTLNIKLTQDPIPQLIRRIAVPASIGFFFNTMYNVVDTYFGGLISTEALAALSLTLPIFFIIVAVGTGFSNGATALIATALGAGQDREAEQLSVQTLTFGLILSAAITLIGLAASPFLFRLLGADGEYLSLCLCYMNVIFFGSLFFVMNYMLNAILNAVGNTRTFRNFLIAGFVLNVILDPWFIYGGLGLPPLGFIGVALATVLIQFLGCFYLGRVVARSEIITGAGFRAGFIPKWTIIKEIIRQGLPASVNMATVGIGIFVITYFISKFGKEGVAAYGAAMRVEQIALLPTIGLNIATLTLVAQNHGAGRFDRIRESLSVALRWGGIMMAAGGVAVFLLSSPLMSLFTKDPQVIEIGATYLKIDALVLYAYVVLFVNVAALQGIKKPMFAITIGLYRQIIAPIIVFYLLGFVLGWGLLGVWWGIFLVTWSAALITVLYARRRLREAEAG